MEGVNKLWYIYTLMMERYTDMSFKYMQIAVARDIQVETNRKNTKHQKTTCDYF